MRRFVALGLAAAALAFPVAGAASADAYCVETVASFGPCLEYTCNDHHCINRTYTAVYTTCQHPFNAMCRRVVLGGVTK